MTETVERPAGALGGARAALRETGASLRSVFANPNLRRLQLALAGSMIGDWAYGTAVAVWAYGIGGAKAVGIWVAIRMALMAISSPFTAVLADKLPRRTVMIGADFVRAALIVGAAACLLAHTPAWPIFVLATGTGLLGTPFRTAQAALTPTLAQTPDELTASNGTSSTLESLAFFLGPAIGASLLTIASVPTVFFLNVATFVWSMLLVASIRVPATEVAAKKAATAGPSAEAPSGEAPSGEAPDESAEPAPAEEKAGFLAETTAGFRAIWADRDLLLVIVEGSAQTIIAGATAVFPLVLAVEIMHTGAKGVGYLDSIFGVGAIIGGVVAIGRASRHRLAGDMTLGVVLWSLPLLLITLWPHPVAVVVALLVLGFGNPLVDVNMYTILQRITPDAVLGRVFGAMEASLIATMALGSALTPLLLHLVGLRATLGILGGVVAVMALAGLPRMRALDRRLVPPAELPLLKGIAIFAPLTPAVLEGLAGKLIRVPVTAGQVVLHEGDLSDRFFIIESGRVQVTAADGRVLREEGPGEFFGEIGLLRDVPRTATITALDDTVLQALERDDFLAAVTGVGESRLAAEDVVRRRLAT